MAVSVRKKRPDISEGTGLIACLQFLLHQQRAIQITCVNYYDCLRT